MKAYYFEGDNGENIIEDEIPADMADHAEEKREELLEAVSDVRRRNHGSCSRRRRSILKIKSTLQLVKAFFSLELTPVFCGSAYKNVGVQKLLHAVNYSTSLLRTT